MKPVVALVVLALASAALLVAALRALRRGARPGGVPVATAAADALPGIDWERRFARFHAAICLVAAAICAVLLATILISLVSE